MTKCLQINSPKINWRKQFLQIKKLSAQRTHSKICHAQAQVFNKWCYFSVCPIGGLNTHNIPEKKGKKKEKG